jgi:ribonuclease HI
MAKAGKKKFYVVWRGKKTGIFLDWATCEAQVKGYPDARFKSFETRTEADAAFGKGAPASKPSVGYEKAGLNKGGTERKTVTPKGRAVGKPVVPSISVDAACNMQAGIMEYRGVDTETQEELFRMGPYQDSTNNMGEYLAIVHALAEQAKRGTVLPIYSDSRNAIGWVLAGRHKSVQKRTLANKAAFELMDRADAWLKEHPIEVAVLKWETKAWGENPADFGRK